MSLRQGNRCTQIQRLTSLPLSADGQVPNCIKTLPADRNPCDIQLTGQIINRPSDWRPNFQIKWLIAELPHLQGGRLAYVIANYIRCSWQQSIHPCAMSEDQLRQERKTCPPLDSTPLLPAAPNIWRKPLNEQFWWSIETRGLRETKLKTGAHNLTVTFWDVTPCGWASATHPRRFESSTRPLWEPQISPKAVQLHATEWSDASCLTEANVKTRLNFTILRGFES